MKTVHQTIASPLTHYWADISMPSRGYFKKKTVSIKVRGKVSAVLFSDTSIDYLTIVENTSNLNHVNNN